jgi:lysozyme
VEWPAPADWAKWGVTAASIQQWVEDYLAQADALWGRSCVVYTYPSFANTVQFPLALGARRLWIASYQSIPLIPAPWTSCVMQQRTGGGGRLASGVPVDTNVVADDATLDDLLA